VGLGPARRENLMYCTSCTACCQLCGDPDLEDCPDCRGEGISDEQMRWITVGTLMLGVIYADYLRREVA